VPADSACYTAHRSLLEILVRLCLPNLVHADGRFASPCPLRAAPEWRRHLCASAQALLLRRACGRSARIMNVVISSRATARISPSGDGTAAHIRLPDEKAAKPCYHDGIPSWGLLVRAAHPLKHADGNVQSHSSTAASQRCAQSQGVDRRDRNLWPWAFGRRNKDAAAGETRRVLGLPEPSATLAHVLCALWASAMQVARKTCTISTD
jgi:hypothetical protein